MKEIKRVCFFGMGGVGGYFGGKMAYNLSRKSDNVCELYFVARGKHLEEIRANGLRIENAEGGAISCRPTLAAESILELPPMDVIFLCVKGYDIEETVKQLDSYIGSDTIIIPMLNGMDIYRRIRNFTSKGIVLPACVYVSSYIDRPGTVKHVTEGGWFIFGKDPNHQEFEQGELLKLLDQAGVDYKWMDNPFPSIWKKYMFISPFALVTARFGKTFGEVMADFALKTQVRGIMEEIRTLAGLEGITIKENAVIEALEMAYKLDYNAKTSFQRDVEQRGKKNEGEILGGAILELAARHGIEVPFTKENYEGIMK